MLLGRPSFYIIRSDNWDNIKTEVSDMDNENLIKAVSNKEIEDAIFDIAADKTLGPDDFPAEFFQKIWPIVGNFVCLALRVFFSLWSHGQ